MAKVTVEIPDGKFCSDRGHLDCLYAEHNTHLHYCNLFRKFLDDLKDVSSNNYVYRIRPKCKECIEAMEDEGDQAIIPDAESRN